MTAVADQPRAAAPTPFATDEERWHAVVTRDAHADGRFWLGVTSTGIFCRPTCSARRPRRDRARFFDSMAEAGAAGFRPCLRCRPTESVRTQLDVVAEACRIIERHAEEPGGGPTLAELGRSVGWSPFHLQRTFRRIVGVTPRQYAENQRMERVRRRLREADSVTDALYEAGWGSSAAFYATAPAHLGMSASAYRDGADGTLIRYTIVGSPVGRLLIARTERGICAINLGDDDAALVRQLGHEFAGAVTERDDEGLQAWAETVLAGLDAAQPHDALPLDVRASAFQRRVWQALRTIPYGETRTYGEVAAAIGSPGAARAVGRACATNPVALVVPCHRVVASGGQLGGYASGVDRKRWLLHHEAEVAKPAER
jgi:AraC family transcriptional regulator of adaptative response/methylated-DNA-[protein]-cysteine methyltransferase